MKGNNELRINHATMIEAVQLWVDSQFLKDWARVESVEQIPTGTYCPEFSIKLTDPPAEEVK